MKKDEIMKTMKKHIPLIIFCACLALDGYSIVAFSDIKNFIPPELQETYKIKLLAGDIAFDVMSLLALWYMDYHGLCSKGKERILFIVIIFLNVMTWIGV